MAVVVDGRRLLVESLGLSGPVGLLGLRPGVGEGRVVLGLSEEGRDVDGGVTLAALLEFQIGGRFLLELFLPAELA